MTLLAGPGTPSVGGFPTPRPVLYNARKALLGCNTLANG